MYEINLMIALISWMKSVCIIITTQKFGLAKMLVISAIKFFCISGGRTVWVNEI